MTFVIDTSVIIDSPEHIKTLSKDGKNLIIITDVVLGECDHLKNSSNYYVASMARKFNASLQDLKIDHTQENGICTISKGSLDQIKIDLIANNNYETNFSNTHTSTVNDKRIVETCLWATSHYDDICLVSNDLALCNWARSRGIKTTNIKTSQANIDKLSFVAKHTIQKADNINLSDASELSLLPCQKSLILQVENSSQVILANVFGGKIEVLDEKKLANSKLPPKNTQQFFLANLISDLRTDIVVCNAGSGTGKTAISLAYAMKLVDSPKNRYEKIVYIRNPIDSIDKEAAIGYKKGSLAEKLEGYFAPLMNILEEFARTQIEKSHIKSSRDLVESTIQEFIVHYDITYPYIGNLRGTNLTNAVVIIDEAQNFSLSSMQLVLTRITDTSKTLIIGDIDQVDSPSLNKNNNALSFMLAQTQKEQDINISGITLTKNTRGRVCDWAQKLFSEHKLY